MQTGQTRKILVVGNGESFSEKTIDYSINLAGRLGFEIVAITVRRGPDMDSEPAIERKFEKLAIAAGNSFTSRAARKGIHCEHVLGQGSLPAVLESLKHRFKRIEFAVTESETGRDQVARILSSPVFIVETEDLQTGKGQQMADDESKNQKGFPTKLIGYGALTAAMYTGVFMHADSLTQLFARGGWYAALPVATVLAFSYAHGNFASHLWSFLGIDAHTTATKRVEKPVRKTARKRPYAYVNPFHRL